MPDPIQMRANYMSHVHEKPSVIVKQASAILEGVDFDTLVGTGLSGAVIVPLLAHRFKKHWLIIRKPGDASHSWRPAEGTLGSRWIFVDDLIDTGATFDRVTEAVENIAESPDFETQFVGSYLYNNYDKPEFRAAPEA